MASYNDFQNNILRDTLIVTLGNCFSSVFAGFGVFSFLGHLAYRIIFPNVSTRGDQVHCHTAFYTDLFAHIQVQSPRNYVGASASVVVISGKRCPHIDFFFENSNRNCLDVDDVVKAGPGLSFIAYPEAIGLLPVCQLFSGKNSSAISVNWTACHPCTKNGLMTRGNPWLSFILYYDGFVRC